MLCAQEPPISTQGDGTHLHGGDLANVPCLHRLVESSRGGEHTLRRHQHTHMLLRQPPCKREAYATPIPQSGRRRTCMLVAWPTSHALTSSSNVERHGALEMRFCISVTKLTSHVETEPCVASASVMSAHHSLSAPTRLLLSLKTSPGARSDAPQLPSPATKRHDT